MDGEGKILVHTFDASTVPEGFIHNLGGLPRVSILMRESLEEDETLVEAVKRGLKEEFGAEGVLEKYLGSEQHFLHTPGGDFEKTTLYFQVRLTQLGERPAHDEESHSVLEWVEPNTLFKRMKEQGAATNRRDLDESKIIESYIRHA